MAAQEKYGFKARTYQAAGFASVAEYKKEHGSDLFIRDIEEYDKICKVGRAPQPQGGKFKVHISVSCMSELYA